MNYNDSATKQLISLLKSHGIKRVIFCDDFNQIFLSNLKNDNFFEVYTSVDPRVASYMACGMYEQTLDPVVIFSFGVTNLRNFYSALTEAYYKKIRILVVDIQQVFNSSNSFGHTYISLSNPNDVFSEIFWLENADEFQNNLKINQALLALENTKNGPVLLSFFEENLDNLDISNLIVERTIKQINVPQLYKMSINKKIVIVLDNTISLDEKTIVEISRFCNIYTAVVVYGHCSNYNGENGILIEQVDEYELPYFDLLLYFSDNTPCINSILCNESCQISCSSVHKDPFKNLSSILDMPAYDFFVSMNKCNKLLNNSLLTIQKKESFCKKYDVEKRYLEFLLHKVPSYTTIIVDSRKYLKILDSIVISNNIKVISNVGNFGNESVVSQTIGCSLDEPLKLCFAILDFSSVICELNCFGNREVKHNMRIILFKNNFDCSDNIIKDYCISLGFDYYVCDSFSNLETMFYNFSNDKYRKSIVYVIDISKEIDTN